MYLYKHLIYITLWLIQLRVIQNAAKSFCKLWSFVAWSSMTYIENTGVGDLVWLRCSLP